MPSSVRTLTQRQLNRAVLARQHLLRRSTASLPAMLESVGGLQMQYAPSGYVGCWSRLEDVSRSRVTGALERRQVVQATLLRSTIHLVSAADFPMLFAATRISRQRSGRRAAQMRKLDEVDYVAIAEQVRGWFGDGPLERRELIARLEAEGVGKDHFESLSQWLELLRVPPQGTWERRRAHLYGLAVDELGVSAASIDVDVAMELLVERYLGGFGPAGRDDLASWAGMPVGAFDRTLGRMTLRRFADEDGDELIDLPRRPLPDASTPAPVRFLGTWDATLLAHARRTQVLPEDLRGQVFSIRRPHSVNTVLVDGQVAGTWRIEERRVVVEPFDTLPARFADQVASERAALETFIS
ncbi:MAG TPA: winged helix DNA-binding domain-containing protein [Euzebyales bacterium]